MTKSVILIFLSQLVALYEIKLLAKHQPERLVAVVSVCGSIHLRHMCQGLNSNYFHIIGDGHQPNSRGLYTHYKDSLLKVG